jgi:Zinc knuckle
MVNRLETLRQEKKMAEELITEFLQIVGQAGINRKTSSDHLHIIEYFRKALEPRLSCKILFSNDVPKMMDGWMDRAIQYNTNWRMENLFLNQDMKVSSAKKADTNKSNKIAHWWRMIKRKDLNVMDVNALIIEERAMLLRQGKCFHCKKTGHMAKDCLPSEQEETSKQKKMDLARFAYTMIKALTKEQKEVFVKMTRIRRIFEMENWIDVGIS